MAEISSNFSAKFTKIIQKCLDMPKKRFFKFIFRFETFTNIIFIVYFAQKNMLISMHYDKNNSTALTIQ